MQSSAYQGGYGNPPFASPRPPMYAPTVTQPYPVIAPEPRYVVNDDSEFKNNIEKKTSTSAGLGVAVVIIVSIILLFGLISSFKIKKHVKPTAVVV